ncbi:MAG: hypothetical protein ACEPOV_10110 [Hyphomicrobiales bacterium]
MMDTNKTTIAFIKLGKVLASIGKCDEDYKKLNLTEVELDAVERLKDEIKDSYIYNKWFIPDFSHKAIASLGELLNENDLKLWLNKYPEINQPKKAKNIGVVMAGNIPAVGFHDLLCVLVSGNNIIAKLSADDNRIMPAIANVLMTIDKSFEGRIKFTQGHLSDFDAIIATGSNNTSRYFDYYFGKYPNIIRKNRNSIAVLTGEETNEQLEFLASDIFDYFGLGCRNISKLYLPKAYPIADLYKTFEKYSFLKDNSRYINNYDYNKSVYLVNKIDHLDNGFCIMKEDTNLISPVSVIHYEFYDDISTLNGFLESINDKLQCIVSSSENINNKINFGDAQNPKLWDYADGIDTMDFLFRI